MRAAIYARVSTGHQDHEMQIHELRQVAEQRGWLVVGEYIDTVTGSKEGPERRRLIEDAHRGMFNTVLVWRFDRFARSAKDLLLGLDSLTSVGVEFSSIREAFETQSAIGRATLTILGAVAELEKISSKSASVLALIEPGERVSGSDGPAGSLMWVAFVSYLPRVAVSAKSLSHLKSHVLP